MIDHLYQVLDFSISIFTAILGIAYPLLLDNMNRVDERYHSAKITGSLVRNPIIRRFDWVVVICIIETVCFPLIILGLNGRYDSCSLIIITIHILTTLALMIGILVIVRLIRLYNNAKELSQILDNTNNQKNKLENLDLLFDISMYLARIKNTEQMYTVMDHIYQTISNEIENFSQQKKNHSQNLPKEVKSVVCRIFKASTFNQEGNLYFLQDNLTSIFYNEFDDTPVSNEQYRLMWGGVLQIVKAGNFRWFQQHWIYASQYGDHLSLNRTMKREVVQEQMDDFVFEQIMLGASLLYYERYDWLNFIFYYSSIFPPEYHSIPSTFALVWHYTKMLEECIDKFPLLEQKYNFLDIDKGVNSDSVIAGKALEYLALLLVRLTTLPNNISIFDIPKENITSYNQILTYRNYVDTLKMKLDTFSDRILRKIFKGDKNLQDGRNKLNNSLKEMSDNFKLSDETKADNENMAIQDIKEKLRSNEKQLNLENIPLSDIEPTAADLLICPIEVGDKLQNIDQFIGDSVTTGIIDQLRRQKLYKYLRTFLSVPSQKKFIIRYFDIEKALNKLGVINVDSFFFIFTGNFNEKNLPLKGNSLYVPIRNTMILICRKNDLPKVTRNIPEDLPEGYEKIGNNLFFSFNSVEEKISVATYAGVEAKASVQYILINVSLSNYTDKFDLDKIQNINQLL